MRIFYLCFLLAFILSSCGVKEFSSSARPINHDIWNGLLQKHVKAEGAVDYRGFQGDSAVLNQYLQLLSSNHPNRQYWSEAERIAYWINAYNAFTIQLMIRHYPTESIKEIKNGIPFVNSVWDIKFIEIEGQIYDLNNIEHSILRSRFNEPRIHFAVNCASASCPRLRNEAYTPSRLSAQLTEQARLFLQNPIKNQISKDEVALSKIFRWFKGDFTKESSLIEFINQYSAIEVNKKARIRYLDYDWRINEWKEGSN